MASRPTSPGRRERPGSAGPGVRPGSAKAFLPSGTSSRSISPNVLPPVRTPVQSNDKKIDYKNFDSEDMIHVFANQFGKDTSSDNDAHDRIVRILKILKKFFKENTMEFKSNQEISEDPFFSIYIQKFINIQNKIPKNANDIITAINNLENINNIKYVTSLMYLLLRTEPIRSGADTLDSFTKIGGNIINDKNLRNYTFDYKKLTGSFYPLQYIKIRKAYIEKYKYKENFEQRKIPTREELKESISSKFTKILDYIPEMKIVFTTFRSLITRQTQGFINEQQLKINDEDINLIPSVHTEQSFATELSQESKEAPSLQEPRASESQVRLPPASESQVPLPPAPEPPVPEPPAPEVPEDKSPPAPEPSKPELPEDLLPLASEPSEPELPVDQSPPVSEPSEPELPVDKSPQVDIQKPRPKGFGPPTYYPPPTKITPSKSSDTPSIKYSENDSQTIKDLNIELITPLYVSLKKASEKESINYKIKRVTIHTSAHKVFIYYTNYKYYFNTKIIIPLISESILPDYIRNSADVSIVDPYTIKESHQKLEYIFDGLNTRYYTYLLNDDTKEIAEITIILEICDEFQKNKALQKFNYENVFESIKDSEIINKNLLDYFIEHRNNKGDLDKLFKYICSLILELWELCITYTNGSSIDNLRDEYRNPVTYLSENITLNENGTTVHLYDFGNDYHPEKQAEIFNDRLKQNLLVQERLTEIKSILSQVFDEDKLISDSNMEIFKDYINKNLDYDELCDIFNNPIKQSKYKYFCNIIGNQSSILQQHIHSISEDFKYTRRVNAGELDRSGKKELAETLEKLRKNFNLPQVILPSVNIPINDATYNQYLSDLLQYKKITGGGIKEDVNSISFDDFHRIVEEKFNSDNRGMSFEEFYTQEYNELINKINYINRKTQEITIKFNQFNSKMQEFYNRLKGEIKEPIKDTIKTEIINLIAKYFGKHISDINQINSEQPINPNTEIFSSSANMEERYKEIENAVRYITLHLYKIGFEEALNGLDGFKNNYEEVQKSYRQTFNFDNEQKINKYKKQYNVFSQNIDIKKKVIDAINTLNQSFYKGVPLFTDLVKPEVKPFKFKVENNEEHDLNELQSKELKSFDEYKDYLKKKVYENYEDYITDELTVNVQKISNQVQSLNDGLLNKFGVIKEYLFNIPRIYINISGKPVPEDKQALIILGKCEGNQNAQFKDGQLIPCEKPNIQYGGDYRLLNELKQNEDIDRSKIIVVNAELKDKINLDINKKLDEIDSNKTVDVNKGIKLLQQLPYTDLFISKEGIDTNQTIFNKIKDIFNMIIENVDVMRPLSILLFGYGFSGTGKSQLLMNTDPNNPPNGLGDQNLGIINQLNNYKNPDYKIDLDIVQAKEFYYTEGGIFNIKGGKNDFEIPKGTDFNQRMKTLTDNIRKERIERTGTIKFTPNNDESSRSHLLIRVKVTLTNEKESKEGYISIVDMGGIEDKEYINKNMVKFKYETPGDTTSSIILNREKLNSTQAIDPLNGLKLINPLLSNTDSKILYQNIVNNKFDFNKLNKKEYVSKLREFIINDIVMNSIMSDSLDDIKKIYNELKITDNELNDELLQGSKIYTNTEFVKKLINNTIYIYLLMIEGEFINKTIQYIKEVYKKGELLKEDSNLLYYGFREFLITYGDIKLDNVKLVLFGNIRQDYNKVEDSIETLKFLYELLPSEGRPEVSSSIPSLSLSKSGRPAKKK